MRRRDFVTLLGGAAAWPLAASAQQKPVIGFLNSGSADVSSDRITAFHQGLRQLGYIDGENVVIVYRWALGQYDRLPAFAAELVEKHVSVLVQRPGRAWVSTRHRRLLLPQRAGGRPLRLHCRRYAVRSSRV